MAFVPRLNSDGMYGSPWWYSNGNPFYATGNPEIQMPNCTCYAYGRYAEIRNAFADLPTGNAGTWWDDPRTANFQTGQTPQLGAVICWAPRPGTYGLGHVGIVEVIEPDGTLKISDSWAGTYFNIRTVYPPDYNPGIYEYYFQGFIYNDAVSGRVSNPYVVAAIAGNFAIESNVNPGIWESLIPCAWDFEYDYTGKGGYGLGQWTNVGTPYGRCWNLHEWVTSNGYTDGDGDGQLAFLLHENYWANSSSTILSYTTLDEFLDYNATVSDLYDLTHDWLINWEGIGTQTLPDRYSYAQRFLAYIELHKNDDPSTFTWISTNNYLSDSEMDNNAMCIYFWLTAGTPTPTPPEKKKKKMPLWMYLNYFPWL